MESFNIGIERRVIAVQDHPKKIINASGGGTLFYATDPDHTREGGSLETGESAVVSERTWLTATGGEVGFMPAGSNSHTSVHVIVLPLDE
jgi:hypothetical protein